MTKKDYIRIADIMQRAQAFREPDARWEFILVGLSAYMKEDNPRFDEAKFADACGL
jgi:hypothetical protein